MGYQDTDSPLFFNHLSIYTYNHGKEFFTKERSRQI